MKSRYDFLRSNEVADIFSTNTDGEILGAYVVTKIRNNCKK